MKTVNRIFVLLILNVSILQASESTIDISKYGAIGDGEVLNTKAIQNAIDECSQQGGGKVVFPAGKWLSGTLLLKSGVTLLLNKNALLMGSPNIEDYQTIEPFTEGTGATMGYCFIGGVDATNIGIEGPGIVDGQGKEVFKTGGKTKRPFLLRLVRCKGISIKNVTLNNSAAWTTHLFECKDIIADSVTIRSKGLANNDGFDIDGSQNVQIMNCEIDTGDDAICLKTTGNQVCKNITVNNCALKSNCGAFKMGTESHADFENIRVNNCRVLNCNGVIKIFSVDGAHIQNVDISNITINRGNAPIVLRLGARLKTFVPGDKKKEVGSLKNIKIRNINATNANVIGILINGIPNHSIENVTIENVTMSLPGGGKPEDAAIRLEEKETAYPEVSTFGRVFPVSSIYIRHVNGITIRNVIISHRQSDSRPVIFAQDIQKLELINMKLPANDSCKYLVGFEDVCGASITEIDPVGNLKIFLNVEGSLSKDIILKNINFTNSENKVQMGAGVASVHIK